MGLFDMFKSGKKDSTPPINIHPEIKVSDIDNGSHGDNIGALIGFKTLEEGTGGKIVQEIIDQAIATPTSLNYQKFSLHSYPLVKNNSRGASLNIRALAHRRQMVSAYPYLKTSYKLPYATKEIIEWKHVHNCEAEIKGGGRDVFGLDFFPTDYAINKQRYQENKNIEVHLSALALVVDKHTNDESGGTKFSEDFVAYMPSSRLPRVTYYDFIGMVISCEEVQLDKLNSGYMAKVRLINHDEDPDFLAVEMFMHKENMRIPSLTPGMKITGLLWFQGEIAST